LFPVVFFFSSMISLPVAIDFSWPDARPVEDVLPIWL